MSARLALLPALALLASLVLAAGGEAQRRRRTPPTPPPVPADADVDWTVFVSAYGDQPARRESAGPEAGTITLPTSDWRCTYSVPNRAQLNETNWSEVRTLECTHGDAIVSTTGFCQIAGPSWGARAGVLSLGVARATTRITVTLDCAVRTEARDE